MRSDGEVPAGQVIKECEILASWRWQGDMLKAAAISRELATALQKSYEIVERLMSNCRGGLLAAPS